MMHQEVVYTPTPKTVSVKGHFDERRQVLYLGDAIRQPNGKYHALAIVNEALCFVECEVTFEGVNAPASDRGGY